MALFIAKLVTGALPLFGELTMEQTNGSVSPSECIADACFAFANGIMQDITVKRA